MLNGVSQVLLRSGVLLWELLPYILFGILISEILKYTPWTRFVKKAVNRSPFHSIIIATVLGIMSPLCTYGTIPIIIDLYRNKVRLAPLLTFLSASSLMNPQLFLITWGGLGGELAFSRLAGVIVFTLLLGFAITALENRLFSESQYLANEKFKRKTSTEKNIRDFEIKSFLKSLYGNLEFVGFYVVLGILLSVTLEALVPLTLIFEMTQGVEWINVIAASILGIPLYACGGAMIPLVDVLLDNGISPGAAVGFLIVGPGTRITPLLALGSFLSKTMLAYYVVSLLLFSMFAGMLINTVLSS